MLVQKSHPSQWGVILVFGLLMVGLLVLTHRLAASLGWREVMDVGVLFLSYGLLGLWLRKNSSSLVQDQEGRGKTRIIVIEPSPSPQTSHKRYLEADAAAAPGKIDRLEQEA